MLSFHYNLTVRAWEIILILIFAIDFGKVVYAYSYIHLHFYFKCLHFQTSLNPTLSFRTEFQNFYCKPSIWSNICEIHTNIVNIMGMCFTSSGGKNESILNWKYNFSSISKVINLGQLLINIKEQAANSHILIEHL